MTCMLDIGSGTPSANGYDYMFQFPSKGSEHIPLGIFFMAIPGYTQVWKWTGTEWVSVGGNIEFLDTVDVTATYGMTLPTNSGAKVPYACDQVAPITSITVTKIGDLPEFNSENLLVSIGIGDGSGVQPDIRFSIDGFNMQPIARVPNSTQQFELQARIDGVKRTYCADGVCTDYMTGAKPSGGSGSILMWLGLGLLGMMFLGGRR